MTVVADEEARTRAVLDRVEELEDIADSLEDGETRARLLKVVARTVDDVGAVRVSVAAGLLNLDQKTVRAWAAEGVLVVSSAGSTARLDPQRLHEVWHLVRDLRRAGKTRGLLDEVFYRLADSALLGRDDLQESLAQMRRGEGDVVRPAPAEDQASGLRHPSSAR